MNLRLKVIIKAGFYAGFYFTPALKSPELVLRPILNFLASQSMTELISPDIAKLVNGSRLSKFSTSKAA